MSNNDGGPAFPAVQTTQEGSAGEYTMDVHSVGGMSLRDYFANGALIGIRAHPAHERPQGVAHWCYQVADAMLAAREVKS